MKELLLCLSASVFLALASTALAQSVGRNSAPPAWGTSSDSAVGVPAAAFTPRYGVALWDTNGAGSRFRLTKSIAGVAITTDPYFDAPVNLPAGALITGLRANVCDANATYDITAWLQIAHEPDGNIYRASPTFGLSTTGSGPCQSLFADLTSYNLRVDHETHSYWVRISLD